MSGLAVIPSFEGVTGGKSMSMSQARPGTPGRYSYSSIPVGLTGRVREAHQLYRMWQHGTLERVGSTLDAVQQCEQRLKERFEVDLERLDVLDVGPGQQLRHMKAMSVKNHVVGIDMDIVPQGFHLGDYLNMLRYNSLLRTVKTVTRKALGWDGRFEKHLASELSVSRFRRLPVYRMNAARMGFDKGSFDLVCSWSAFEHIDMPRQALSEVARVLRPGGVAYLAIHLYTSHSGNHDPRSLTKDGMAPPYWPHLRACYREEERPSCYVNELRMHEWKQLFEQVMPGTQFIHERQEELLPHLRELQSRGELGKYSEDELLTVGLVAMWQKPRKGWPLHVTRVR